MTDASASRAPAGPLRAGGHRPRAGAGAPVSVTVVRDQEATASPTTGASGTLVLDLGVLDAMGMRQRGPVKVSPRRGRRGARRRSMGDLEGERASRTGCTGRSSRPTGRALRGEARRYRAVSRGADHDVAMMDVAVPAGGEATLRADVRPALDTAGMVSADFHQHTVGSIDRAARSATGC